MSGDGLSRRKFLELGAAGVAVGAVPFGCTSQPGPQLTPTELGALVIDASAPMASPDRGFEDFRAYALDARAAGVDVCLVPVARRERLEAALRNLILLREYCGRLPSDVAWISDAADLASATAERRLGIVPMFHGMQMIEEQFTLLPALRASGVAAVQLTSGWKNFNADGCFERSDTGLTGLGRMAIAALEDANIRVDLSGSGRKSSIEAARLARKPVVFSHSNAARVHPHAANLTDEQLDACAATGGVIGLTAFPALVAAGDAPSLEDFLRHLDHIVQRIGIDHVGLGLGFDDRPLGRFESDSLPDPPYRYPSGLDTIAALPALREAMRRRGLSEAETDQILGGNFARVLIDSPSA